jgi:GT2 family glycosyltransferase
MNIGFVFTNFNNSLYTREVVKSLEEGSGSNSFTIVIVDNCSSTDDVESLKIIQRDFPRVKLIYNKENVGYFSGLNIGIKYLRQLDIIFGGIVVGNNDLVFPGDFLERMTRCKYLFRKHAVISPDIVTLDGVHQNPHVRDKTSNFREIVWDVYYSNYFIAQLIRWVAKVTRSVTERKDYTGYNKNGVIYQGYGACYILTPQFFRNFEELWSPTFLMGEEFFLWKQLSDRNLTIFYEPNIVVSHHDHATVAKVPSRIKWDICKKSHSIYKKYK